MEKIGSPSGKVEEVVWQKTTLAVVGGAWNHDVNYYREMLDSSFLALLALFPGPTPFV